VIRAGVMGWPVEHSRSPLLHRFWLRQHGIDGAYDLLPVPPEGLAAALRALPERGFAGCNLTQPHKEAALAIIDEVAETGRRVGAVNTIVVRPHGRLEGRNTDAFGFLANLQATRPDWRATAGPAVVLGAGGGARAVVAALADAGVPEIRLVNRHRDRAVALAAALGGPLEIVAWADRAAALAGAALLVNSTSLGMAGQPPLALVLDALPSTAVVYDIVYAPLETPLLAAARARGNPAVDGLGMLLHQGRQGFAAWFGVLPEVTPALRAAVAASLGGR
jgi:shikimate dehydrogenase